MYKTGYCNTCDTCAISLFPYLRPTTDTTHVSWDQKSASVSILTIDCWHKRSDQLSQACTFETTGIVITKLLDRHHLKRIASCRCWYFIVTRTRRLSDFPYNVTLKLVSVRYWFPPNPIKLHYVKVTVASSPLSSDSSSPLTEMAKWVWIYLVSGVWHLYGWKEKNCKLLSRI